MNKVDEFTEAAVTTPMQEFTKLKAVSVTGLQQPPDWLEGDDEAKNVWVLNETVQIDGDGHIIPPRTTPYVWLGTICKKRIELFKQDKTTRQIQEGDQLPCQI